MEQQRPNHFAEHRDGPGACRGWRLARYGDDVSQVVQVGFHSPCVTLPRRVAPGAKALVTVDIVGMENGRLAEHWDVWQDEATKAEWNSGFEIADFRLPERARAQIEVYAVCRKAG